MAERSGYSVMETDGNEPNNSEDNPEEFAAIMKQGFEALMPTIRASNSLPKGQQWDLFCTSPSFKPIMDSLGNKAQELMSLILNHQGIHREIRRRDLEEKYELIIEANDKILERVGMYLDELSGIRRNPSQSVSDVVVSPVVSASGSWNRDVTQSSAWKEKRLSVNAVTPVVLRNARVTGRPQVKFHDKIDNRSVPWEPRIKDKPNALKPLAILFESLPGEEDCYSHPYEFELERFQERIDSMDLSPKNPKQPRPIEETPLLMITQEDQLQDMLGDLRKQTEIAVDLEHHSYRSFQGFTCLMQISTRETDYIVDTLELRHKLHILNEVFTDPKVIKVFHGAESDIQWLQRDFSLYVVNMFDTYQAALLLSLPRLSLAHLLKTICNIDANKTFQLYDWRTRPLAKEAIKYAREDTHYLLYIYEVLWNRLLEKSNGGTQMLESSIFRSADTCKRRYWKYIFKEDSYEGMYLKSKKNFDNRQMYAMKELYAWRDKIAREEDESIGYVLPNHMLMLIAEQLPKEMQGILACCNPIPPLVRQNLVFLHQIVLKAREQPLVARISTVNSETRIRPTPQTNINMDGALHCPHDLTHSSDFRNDLPTLLDNNHNNIVSSSQLLEHKSSLKIFGEMEDLDNSKFSRISLPNQIHFWSPYERYKKMLLYEEAEAKKTKEQKEEEILQDTQKLLDQCLRERLKSAAAKNTLDNSSEELPNISSTPVEITNIKEEKKTDSNRNPRKRDRSQDSTNGSEISLISYVKDEDKKGLPEQKWPKTPLYQAFIASINNPEIEIAGPPPVQKNKKAKTEPGGANKLFSNKKKGKTGSSSNFTPYDYNSVDYNEYQNSQTPVTAKRSADKFKQKGKKKQQNRMFTFQRQYGNSSGKKKS